MLSGLNLCSSLVGVLLGIVEILSFFRVLVWVSVVDRDRVMLVVSVRECFNMGEFFGLMVEKIWGV